MKRKNLFKIISVVLTLAILIGVIPVITAQGDDYDVKPENVNIIEKKVIIKKGQKVELHSAVTPHYADDDMLVWRVVKGKKIVKIVDNGDDEIEIIGKKKGTAKISCGIRGTNKKDYVTIKVKANKKVKATIKRIGKLNRVVEVDDDFELKVKKSSSVKNKDLRWSISDKRIVDFDYDDYYDNKGAEAEFEAKRTGQVKITCKNKRTKKKVVFKIKVVNDYDDDDYDD